MTGEGGVGPAGLPGELPTEPRGRDERCGLGPGAELDLHDAQPSERTGVEVHLGDVSERVVEGDSVSCLVDAPSERVRPQCFCLLGRDRDVDLGSRHPRSRLHRERRVRRRDPDPNLHGAFLGEVALPEVDTGAELFGRRRLGQEELAFDLDRHGISMKDAPRPWTTFDTMKRAATFHVGGHEAGALDALTDLGFVFSPPEATTTTLLDTFDGLLHRAGLRLRATECDRVDLELSGEGTTPAHVAVDAPPRVPTDLPAGPFRSRVAALVGVRALLPQLRVGALRSRGVLRDAAGKTVVVAEFHEGLQIIDRVDIDCPTATIEIHEVPGYAKHAARTLKALRALGIAECGTDTLSLCATAADVDLAGFTATASVPLDPATTAIDGYRLVLANLAITITANWQGTIAQSDTEFLHDLRIGVRRTRTVLADAKQVLPAAILDHTRVEFAWLADLTSTPRDLDVYLVEWSNYTDPLGADAAPLLEPVRDLLERRRTEAHVDLERGLRSERAATLMAEWQAWLTEPLAEPLDGDGLPPRARRPIGRLVAGRIARAHGILLERGRLIGTDTPAEQVHDLRKDAKKLRYLLECFGSLLPESARKQYVKRLKALQDNLGEHQDAEVHVQLLRTVAGELHKAGASAETMVAIGQLTERLDQQRHAARVEFAERFAAYDTPATQRALDAMLDGINE